MRIYINEIDSCYCDDFGNMHIRLDNTEALDAKIDSIRLVMGKQPIYVDFGDGINNNAWYDFDLVINKYTGDPLRIEVIVGGDAPDAEKTYTLGVDDPEDMRRQVELQLGMMDMTLADLLKEVE